MGDAKYKQKHRAGGLCLHCPRPVYKFYSMCEECLKRQRNYARKNNAKRRKYFRENHLCTRCSAPLLDDTHVTCMNCRQERTILITRRAYAKS